LGIESTLVLRRMAIREGYAEKTDAEKKTIVETAISTKKDQDAALGRYVL